MQSLWGFAYVWLPIAHVNWPWKDVLRWWMGKKNLLRLLCSVATWTSYFLIWCWLALSTSTITGLYAHCLHSFQNFSLIRLPLQLIFIVKWGKEYVHVVVGINSRQSIMRNSHQFSYSPYNPDSSVASFLLGVDFFLYQYATSFLNFFPPLCM